MCECRTARGEYFIVQKNRFRFDASSPTASSHCRSHHRRRARVPTVNPIRAPCAKAICMYFFGPPLNHSVYTTSTYVAPHCYCAFDWQVLSSDITSASSVRQLLSAAKCVGARDTRGARGLCGARICGRQCWVRGCIAVETAFGCVDGEAH